MRRVSEREDDGGGGGLRGGGGITSVCHCNVRPPLQIRAGDSLIQGPSGGALHILPVKFRGSLR
eukprot:1309886-Pyramimonas_sp.AAC.1